MEATVFRGIPQQVLDLANVHPWAGEPGSRWPRCRDVGTGATLTSIVTVVARRSRGSGPAMAGPLPPGRLDSLGLTERSQPRLSLGLARLGTPPSRPSGARARQVSASAVWNTGPWCGTFLEVFPTTRGIPRLSEGGRATGRGARVSETLIRGPATDADAGSWIASYTILFCSRWRSIHGSQTRPTRSYKSRQTAGGAQHWDNQRSFSWKPIDRKSVV